MNELNEQRGEGREIQGVERKARKRWRKERSVPRKGSRHEFPVFIPLLGELR